MPRKPGPRIDRKSPPRAPLTERILTVLKSIPKGMVASYGQIAALAGSPRGARQVVRILHTLSRKEKLPWHRVINSAGRISLPMDAGGARQAALLRKERVEVSENGAVDLRRFGWRADVPKRIKPAGPSSPASSRSRAS
jgi:methylated-DNA-protein-cysteine methyltransferase-like protein